MLLLLFFGAAVSSFDVVGWYIGDNFTDWPLSDLRWDIYSTIRFGEVQIAGDGTCTAPGDAAFAQMLSAARAHNRTVTLGPGLNVWGCVHNASLAAYCKTYTATVGAAVRSLGRGVAGVEFDYECPPTAAGHAGIVSKGEARAFTQLLDGVQRSMAAATRLARTWGSGGCRRDPTR